MAKNEFASFWHYGVYIVDKATFNARNVADKTALLDKLAVLFQILDNLVGIQRYNDNVALGKKILREYALLFLSRRIPKPYPNSR